MISQAEYARHLGVQKMNVSRAVKSGKLAKCVIRDEAGRPMGLSSIEEADQEWAANSDYTDAPQRAPGAVATTFEETQADPSKNEREPPPVPKEPEFDATISGGAARQKHWAAKLAELKYKEAAGELVLAKDVEHRLTDVFSACRTRLLGVASRAKQTLPHLSVADIAQLDQLIREALEELSEAEA